jgi:hypothetical protein
MSSDVTGPAGNQEAAIWDDVTDIRLARDGRGEGDARVGPLAGMPVAPPIAERRVAFGDAVVGIGGGFNRGEGTLQGHGCQVCGGRMEPVLRFLIFGSWADFSASAYTSRLPVWASIEGGNE